jgi:uncharacterized membrane protein
MEWFKKIIGYTVVALQILIVVVLLFENRVEVPSWLQALGRTHPLLLHLPIGFLLLAAMLVFFERIFEVESVSRITTFLLFLSAITASLSAFMGLLLSREGGYSDNDLTFHKWFGIAVSFLCWILISVDFKKIALKIVLGISVMTLIVAGHFGANLTHGENFVFEPLQKQQIKARKLTDSTTLFAAAIEPIFETKCYSCHNDQKSKGRLVLTYADAILKGGKHGKLWEEGDVDKSLLIERLNLPLEHKEHMPPKDKAQLTLDEIDFISRWIDSGADMNRLYSKTDSLGKSAQAIVDRYYSSPEESIYKFEFASAEKLEELNTPYRTVFQVAKNEPAVQADFFLAGNFKPESLKELSAVKDQLVALNLSKMPITDDDLKNLSQFRSLEKIILNNTSITGEGLSALTELPNLSSVSLSGTKVTSLSLLKLAENKNLREVYLWSVDISQNDIGELRQKFSHIQWETGYQPDLNEKLKLSQAILKNDGQVLKADEKVSFKHNLPGTVIRYTVNGDKPDSVKSLVYESSLAVSKYTLVKTKAYKDGWLSSDVTEHVFFPNKAKPSKVKLVSNPDKKYQGEGGQTFIDDKKGMPDFYRDPSWMGFREESLEAVFYFDEKNTPTISNITLSYARNVYAMCMPPAEMEVWGGDDERNLTLLGKIKPIQPTEYVSVRIEGADIEFKPSTYRCYKLIAKPLAKLPGFRKEKKEKGWLMVDEVFFN